MSQPAGTPDFLQLSENMPTTVYVRYFPDASDKTKDKVGFATNPNGPYYKSGIEWHNIPPGSDSTSAAPKADNGSAKFLLLALEAPVNGIKCDLRYSPTFKHETADLAVQMCVPSGNFKASYHFDVSIFDGRLGATRALDIDPQIIVTPVNVPVMI